MHSEEFGTWGVFENWVWDFLSNSIMFNDNVFFLLFFSSYALHFVEATFSLPFCVAFLRFFELALKKLACD